MIQANELRIGNYIEAITYCNSNGIQKIEQIRKHPSGERNWGYVCDFSKMGIPGSYVEDCNPIPLTEKLLNNCNRRQMQLIADLLIIIENKSTEQSSLCVKHTGLQILSVHHLQNFFYFNTFQELQIML